MRLTPDEAKRIKAMMWNGSSHSAISREIGMSESHVSRIANGTAWREAPWPDGSLGAISSNRRRELATRYNRSNQHGTRTLEQSAADGDGERNSVDRLPQLRGTSHTLHAHFHGDNNEGMDQHNAGVRGVDRNSSVRDGTIGVSEASVEVPSEPAKLSEQSSPDEAEVFYARQVERKALSDNLDRLAELAKQEAIDEVEASLRPAGPPRTKHSSGSNFDPNLQLDISNTPKLPWAIIERNGARVPLVQLACSASGEAGVSLQLAIRIAFYMLPRSQWTKPIAAELISNVVEAYGLDLSELKLFDE